MQKEYSLHNRATKMYKMGITADFRLAKSRKGVLDTDVFAKKYLGNKDDEKDRGIYYFILSDRLYSM